MELTENKIIRISFVGFFIIFGILFYFDQNYEPEIIKIENLEKNSGQSYLIIGKLIKQSLNGDNLFITISDPEKPFITINGIIFKIKKKLILEKVYKFQVETNVYNDNLGLIVERVKPLNLK